MKKQIAISDKKIIEKNYLVRGQKIMIDRDLALLYNVQTKVLKQAAKRNRERFPDDFMFEMSRQEFQNWRSQFVTSKSKDKMGLRYSPYCFTEQGVAMLSSVLKSKKAIEVNIQIIRIFTRMRRAIASHKDILLKLSELEKKVSKNDKEIHVIFEALKQLIPQPITERKRMGYKPTWNTIIDDRKKL
ncbi:MAG: ORF6N domain-containing protein [Bacteroidota bacterium]